MLRDLGSDKSWLEPAGIPDVLADAEILSGCCNRIMRSAIGAGYWFPPGAKANIREFQITGREAKAMSGVKDMLAAANASVPRLKPEDVRGMMGRNDVLIVDVRDPTEVAGSGKVKGAVNVSRGMLEFRADPESPSHNPAFLRDKTVVLYCGSGGRAALSGKTLQEFGYKSVYNAGAFKELAEAGLETEPA